MTTYEELEAQIAANSTDAPGGAWIARTEHEHCKECTALIDPAIAHARVTGSTGATCAVEQWLTESRHSATVQWETPEQRRIALATGVTVELS